MRALFLLLVLFLPNGPAINPKRHPNEEQKSVAFVHTAVIDTVAGSVEQDMTVVIIGNHIAEVAHAGVVKIPISAHVVDGRGKFLMPGLWDMHVHIFSGGDSPSRLHY